LYIRRDTGQLLPLQQTMPQGFSAFTVGAPHMSLPVHPFPLPHRQTGVDPLVSHHSPYAQQAPPQQGLFTQVAHDALVLAAQTWPAVPAAPPLPAVPPPCPPTAPPVPVVPPVALEPPLPPVLDASMLFEVDPHPLPSRIRKASEKRASGFMSDHPSRRKTISKSSIAGVHAETHMTFPAAEIIPHCPWP
jgi:hypothetical protein